MDDQEGAFDLASQDADELIGLMREAREAMVRLERRTCTMPDDIRRHVEATVTASLAQLEHLRGAVLKCHHGRIARQAMTRACAQLPALIDDLGIPVTE